MDILDFISNDYVKLFFISMFPIVELRGAMPIGITAMQLPFWKVYLTCVTGNILPVPFLVLFSKTVLSFLARQKYIGKFFQKIIDKADQKSKTIGKYELLGLVFFVLVPVPGTGAWMGSLIAAILRLRTLPAFAAIVIGVLCCGIIMGIFSFGLLEAITALF